MKINAINFSNNIVRSSFRGANTPTKTSKPKEDLLYAADKLEIPDQDENDRIASLLSKNKAFEYLGEGYMSVVRKIPYTNYAIKVYKNNDSKSLSVLTDDINPKEKLNNLVAKGEKGDYKILRYIDGVCSENATTTSKKLAYYEIANNMPQSAYDEYLRKMALVHRAGMYFDTIGDNMIVDIKNGKFEVIDLALGPVTATYGNCISKLDDEDIITINPIECMYKGVFNTMGKDNYFEFFAKSAIAAAKDCIYFTNFDYTIKKANNKHIENKIKSIYSSLEKLHYKKLKLRSQGKDSEAIAKILEKDINKFIQKVERKIAAKDDLDSEELMMLAKEIV